MEDADAHFDEATLAALVDLVSLDPNGEPIEALVELFASNAREHVQAMRDATPGSSAWMHAAHSLKSSAGMFGATALSRACADAEMLARDAAGGEATAARHALHRVEDSLAHTLAFLGGTFPGADLRQG